MKLSLKIIIGSIIGVGSVVGGIITMVIVNKVDKADIKETNVENNTTDLINLRIGVWNVLNYNAEVGEKGEKAFKTKALAKIIYSENDDIIGLAEIEGEDSLEVLVGKLNYLAKDSVYRYIRSKESGAFKNGEVVGSNGQQEYYGFIYNNKKVTPKTFDGTNEIGSIYENPKMENELIPGEKTGFVRPPYAVEFEDKNHKDFTIAVGHLDSPGGKNDSIKGNIKENYWHNDQGTQEVWEAKHLVDVMNYFDSIDGKNDDLIFLGDTNIKSNITNVFQTLKDNGFSALSDPTDDAFKTSLGTKNNWSQPYDRIFVKSDLMNPSMQQTRFDFFDPSNLSTYFIPMDVSTYALNSKYIDSNGNINLKGIRYKISDHTTVHFELDFTKDDTDLSGMPWDEYLNNTSPPIT